MKVLLINEPISLFPTIKKFKKTLLSKMFVIILLNETSLVLSLVTRICRISLS